MSRNHQQRLGRRSLKGGENFYPLHHTCWAEGHAAAQQRHIHVPDKITAGSVFVGPVPLSNCCMLHSMAWDARCTETVRGKKSATLPDPK